MPERILVVDDEAAARRFLVRALTRAGYATVEAADGEAALGLVDAAPVDLVLLDIQMPGLGGLGVLAGLREHESARHLPVIIVTGTGDLDDRIAGLEAGATDFLVKPVHPSELVARVRSHLRDRDAWLDTVERRLASSDGAPPANGEAADAGFVPEGPADVALRIVDSMGASGDHAFVAILECLDSGSVAPLAFYARPVGSRLGSGQALPQAVGSYLRERALLGAWVEDARGITSGFGHLGAFSQAALGMVATAPLHSGDDLTGLLVIGWDAATPASGELMDIAIRSAGVVSAALGSRLGEAGARSGIHRRVVDIVRNGSFSIVFQPIVKLEGRGVVGYEALTRFADGVAPGRRFSEAARAGVGEILELATMRAALSASTGLTKGPWISLNASPDVLVKSEQLSALLTGIDRELVLEITETLPVADYAAFRASMDRLEGRVRLAIDDAGAGFSSMRHVLELHPAFVKLDISLTRGIETDRARQALVAGLTHFARRAGSHLIAEGVETEAEVVALRILGVELGQGHLFGRPTPAGART